MLTARSGAVSRNSARESKRLGRDRWLEPAMNPASTLNCSRGSASANCPRSAVVAASSSARLGSSSKKASGRPSGRGTFTAAACRVGPSRYRVTAVEPSRGLRALAMAKHRHDNITWIDDALPALAKVRVRSVLGATPLHAPAGPLAVQTKVPAAPAVVLAPGERSAVRAISPLLASNAARRIWSRDQIVGVEHARVISTRLKMRSIHCGRAAAALLAM